MSSIQFNLLPDVKLEYIKAQRTHRLVLGLSILVTAVAIGLLALLLVVSALQKKHINDVTKNITQRTQTLKAKPQISRVLTVQNQLDSLTPLHGQKPATSRILGYLNQLTPADVGITSFDLDVATTTMIINGKAKSLSDVNKYIDTLKFTKYEASTDGSKQKGAPFKDVVLSSFGLTSNVKDGRPANYTITLAYDPAVFNVISDVKLVVPSITTTRSDLSDGSDLFQAPNTEKAAQ